MDEEFDLSSELFNAEKALSNPEKVKVPIPSCSPLDNLGKFRSLILMKTPSSQFHDNNVQFLGRAKRAFAAKMAPKAVVTERFSQSSSNESLMEKGKRFLQEQVTKNKQLGGPFETLYKALTSQTAVQIRIRNQNEHRSTVTGIIAAYDRFMNLLVTDASEQWPISRKKNGKRGVTLSGAEAANITNSVNIATSGSIQIEKIYDHTTKTLFVQRNAIPVMFISGHQIISVSLPSKIEK